MIAHVIWRVCGSRGADRKRDKYSATPALLPTGMLGVQPPTLQPPTLPRPESEHASIHSPAAFLLTIGGAEVRSAERLAAPMSPQRRRRPRRRFRRDASMRSAPASSLLLVQVTHGSSDGVVRPTGGRSIGVGDLEPTAEISGANCCRIRANCLSPDRLQSRPSCGLT